jgi:para-aminobenzoate synthetase component 1
MISPIVEEINNPPPITSIFSVLKDRRYPFFLDGACRHEDLGRFSFLGCDPFLVFKSKRDTITLEWHRGRTENFKSDPFIALRNILKRYKLDPVAGISLTSGAVGYFAYDLKDFLEKLPDKAVDDIGLPECIMGFYDVVIVRDNLEKKTYVASSGFPETEEAKNLIRQKARLKYVKNMISSALAEKVGCEPSIGRTDLSSNFSRAEYAGAISRAKRYIKEGDIYQVNLSQRFSAKIDIKPSELYLRLREISPAPMSAYLDFKDAIILSSSPERFLLKRSDYIETRPIKGTRPRGKDEFEDAILEKELITSAKDHAEHIMIVDLERNDLGRICEYGSVRPVKSFISEKYANVFHLVSIVAGRLKKGMDAIDCLAATFPGGSITGAPKIRAMEIIEELEGVKRSVYTGAIGYISFDGNMDTSIAIRTFVVKNGEAFFQAGGGIVADSIADDEYEETLDKAEGLMKTLGAERMRNNRCQING